MTEHIHTWGDKIRQNARATTTRQREANGRRKWREWCAASGVQDTSATPEQVEQYIHYRMYQDPVTTRSGKVLRYGVSLDTVERDLREVARLHQEQGVASPTETDYIRDLLRGLSRLKPIEPERKQPVTADMLRQLPDDTLQDLRDRAFMLLGWAGCLRSGELVSLDVSDVNLCRAGMQVRIRRSKTDTEGRGADVDIIRSEDNAMCPVRAVQAWIKAAGLAESDPLFVTMKTPRHRLSYGGAKRLIKTRVAELGYDPALFAGHSLRAGGATHLVERGVPNVVVAKHGRWKSPAMLVTYYRSGLSDALNGVY